MPTASSHALPFISLLHATRGRPAQALAAREAWLNSAKHRDRVEHLFAVDADDSASRQALADLAPLVVEKSGGGCVAAWNLAAEHCSGGLLIQLSDDWIPFEHWDEALLQRVGNCEEPKVLRISDGHRHDDLLCMAICTRARYRQQGYFLHPSYTGVFSDDEFSYQAYKDGVVVDALDIQFTHQHPDYDPGVVRDETYLKQNSSQNYIRGRQLFLKLNPDALGCWLQASGELRHFDRSSTEAELTGSLPLISIIMRTHDRPHLIGRALQSVADQSYPKLEVVFVARAAALEYAPSVAEAVLTGRGIPWKMVESEPEMKLGAMLNLGVQHASGDWIIVLDDDDSWQNDCLEKLALGLLAKMNPPPRAAACQHALVEEITEADGSIREVARFNATPRLTGLLLTEQSAGNQVVIHAFLYEKALWKEVGGYDETLTIAEDWDFNLKCLRVTDVMVIPLPLANYHVRPHAVRQTHTRQKLEHAFSASRMSNLPLRGSLDSKEGLGHLAATSQISATLLKVSSEMAQLVAQMNQLKTASRELKACKKKLKQAEKDRDRLRNKILEWNQKSWFHRAFHRLRIKSK